VRTVDDVYLRSERAVEELRAINARFIHNFVTNDAEGHSRLLHETFVAIQSDGSVLDRATYLKNWESGFSAEVIPYWDTRGEIIRVVGSTALVRATNAFVVCKDGVEVERATTYTDTYTYVHGEWLCLQAQSTAVQPVHAPAATTIISVYRAGVLDAGAVTQLR
jgi:hypothetical protein